MARSKVKNPFKQQQSLWVHYLLLIFLAFFLTISVVYVRSPGPDTTLESSHDTQELNKKQDKILNEGLISAEDDESNDDDDGFDFISTEEFPEWLREYHKTLIWPRLHMNEDNEDGTLLNRETLLESVRMGCTNLADNQNVAGSFNYLYDFVERKLDSSDSDVRQAGALWGMSLCYQNNPSNHRFRKAAEKGIKFFMDLTVDGPKKDSVLIQYPDALESSTGTNALFGLAMIEYLRTVESNKLYEADMELVNRIRTSLKALIESLLALQRPNKHFAEGYSFETNLKSNQSSPYFDGETMLCLVKATKYIDGFEHIVPIIEDAAPVLTKSYSIDTWATDGHDSDKTKGFYQWSSMFFAEYYEAKWKDYDLYGDFVVSLGHWIIYTHNVLSRRKNTGYAFEGMISALRIAEDRHHLAAIESLKQTIDTGLYKLTTWQVGGPLAEENAYLQANPTDEAFATGGIMSAKNDPSLRIDTTQHQMHACIMALESVYI